MSDWRMGIDDISREEDDIPREEGAVVAAAWNLGAIAERLEAIHAALTPRLVRLESPMGGVYIVDARKVTGICADAGELDGCCVVYVGQERDPYELKGTPDEVAKRLGLEVAE